ncbi:MAG: S41 family peptidase [Bacillota bacterium]|nr:S41 family peptidase [Bacillota bacterium]
MFLKRCPVFAGILILALVFSAAFFPATAFMEDQGPLLREIEEYIREYYFYPPVDDLFPLDSTDDLESVFSDPYSAYLFEEQFRFFEESLGRSLSGVGIYLEAEDSLFLVVSTVPGSPAQREGIKSGDLIFSVDGRSVSGLALEEVIALIRGEKGKRVDLGIRRQGEIMEFTLFREKIRVPAVEYAWSDEGIAIVRLYNFDLDSAQELILVLDRLEKEGLKAIILDLRSNQGGYFHEALEMASLFTEGVLLQIKGMDSAWEEVETLAGDRRKFPMVVLINGGSASAAEILAAALKDNGAALLVGEISYGKGTMQTLFQMDHGGYLKLTTAEFASPLGNRIEGNGVEPHFLVYFEDEQLLTALKLMRYRLEEGDGGVSLLDAALREMRDEDSKIPLPEQINGDTYFPLRAALLYTGRTIQSEKLPGVYNFNWENRLYTIDINLLTITCTDSRGKGQISNIFLYRDYSYVSRAFLEQEVGISFLKDAFP